MLELTFSSFSILRDYLSVIATSTVCISHKQKEARAKQLSNDNAITMGAVAYQALKISMNYLTMKDKVILLDYNFKFGSLKYDND